MTFHKIAADSLEWVRSLRKQGWMGTPPLESRDLVCILLCCVASGM